VHALNLHLAFIQKHLRTPNAYTDSCSTAEQLLSSSSSGAGADSQQQGSRSNCMLVQPAAVAASLPLPHPTHSAPDLSTQSFVPNQIVRSATLQCPCCCDAAARQPRKPLRSGCFVLQPMSARACGSTCRAHWGGGGGGGGTPKSGECQPLSVMGLLV
jgi:hypothetical protein